MKHIIILSFAVAVLCFSTGCATMSALGILGCLEAVAAGTSATVSVITLHNMGSADTGRLDDEEAD